MENNNLILAQNIQLLRKKKGITQEELAEKLGVTFQAVSKWENAKSAPDIFFLPDMAKIFGCGIGDMFSRENKARNNIDIPFEDDGVIRIFQTVGNRITKVQEKKENSCFEIEFPKNCNETTRQYFKVEVYGNIVSDGSICGDVVCHGNAVCRDIVGDMRVEYEPCSEKHSVTVEGNIAGGCNVTGDLSVGGDISGGCYATRDLNICGNATGGCNSGRDMTVVLNVSGGVNAAGSASVAGEIRGGVNCAGEVCGARDIYGDINAPIVTVQGNVEADKIRGNVTCNSVSCDKIEGEVTINK